ncbi:unnamed protein product [Fusarium venenatum]|uniref:Uncharacterized protein n=1 Tax=Fusarium venenatum TaxID=56646 RepID=A0A2L2SRD4_9HYPO|nr:uncharacterized protein FVRRES_12182 [Fusarium venenatum]CEI39491.1 unnamed protein product [Fusarium venenatum]
MCSAESASILRQGSVVSSGGTVVSSRTASAHEHWINLQIPGVWLYHLYGF